MKFLKQGLSLALLGAGLAVIPATPSTSAPAAAADRSVVQRMKDDAQGTARVTAERATGRVGFARASDLLPSVSAGSARTAAAKASSYLDRYATAFGAAPDQLEQREVTSDAHGWTVDYAQVYRGVEVFGAKLRAHLDPEGDLTSVNGYAAPGLSLDVTPDLTAAEAGERAVAIVRAKPANGQARPGRPTGLRATTTDLRVYRMGSTRGVEGEAVLAYVAEVTNGSDVRDTVILDATTGKTLNRWSMIAHALDRELYEAFIADDGGTPDDPSDDEIGGLDEPIWTEGDPFPGTLDQDQRNEVQGTGEAYWMFMNTFGRDSYDGAGAPMITVNNDPRIACPNANWNGVTTNYCTGVTGDDTVAHEWAHAYTEYTSGLVYQWQSGAMNEAYSDIWGETVDMLNDRLNETPDAPRTADTCSAYTRSAVGLTINSPAEIAGPCDAAPAAFGPVIDDEGVTDDLVVGIDANDAAGPSTTDGCSPFTNAGDVSGAFVYVDRGTCPFAQKAANAEDAGAVGIVIGNNVPGEAPFSISGDAEIYGVMVRQEDGTRIKAATSPINVTIADIDEDAKDDSYRWLSGESDPAFGGAIRDMWNPTCYGDPGKVSDAEYKCSTDDNGGVHSNSGVVNRAFALLVDGGTSNGVTVPAIGLDKAANLFWRTQTQYLTPVSDFVDLADGLAASCTDLTGGDIKAVTLGSGPTGGGEATAPAAEPIEAADCAAVAAAAEAVELRLDPTEQCGFEPMLAKNAPRNCGKGYRTTMVFSEDFEDGLAGWSASQEIVNEGASGVPWTSTTGPTGNTSKVAFGPDPDGGACDGSSADLSSRNSITSRAIRVPKAAAARMSFDHYVATEYGYDGGNLKVSVDGGPFTVPAPAAYVFNGPNAQLEPAPDGTSPLAGESAWTGTDGGENSGSWGTTVLNLRKLAKAGQKLRFRFDMGRDGCGGLDGWYVDNIKVQVCHARTTTTARSKAAVRPRVTVRVKRNGSSGAAPAGVVKLYQGKKVVGRAVLRKGKAVVKVRGLRPGTHRVRAKYQGSAAFLASADAVKVTVKKRRR